MCTNGRFHFVLFMLLEGIRELKIGYTERGKIYYSQCTTRGRLFSKESNHLSAHCTGGLVYIFALSLTEHATERANYGCR
jgi:hypothetical protein